MKELLSQNRFIRFVNIRANPGANRLELTNILKLQSHARTNIIMDCQCEGAQRIIQQASDGCYFNKTYQWLLLEHRDQCLGYLSQPEIEYFGPNAQIVVLREQQSGLEFWDLHTKGHHLGAHIEQNLVARAAYDEVPHKCRLQKIRDLSDVQGIHYRGQFRGFTLRGATVVSHQQCFQRFSDSTKDYPFVSTVDRSRWHSNVRADG